MLDKEIFKTKYDTNHLQVREESFLEEVSEEDRELYNDLEILSGKSENKINKFYNIDGKNKNKKYNTVRIRATNAFKKFIDNKITNGELEEVYEKIFSSSKKGDFNFCKMLLERMLGKEEENIKVESKENINITFGPNKQSIKRQQENLDKKE